VLQSKDMAIIDVKNLFKYFRIYKKEPGVLGSVKSLFNRKFENAKAVDNISFEINEGELIGFIGPNGAGKTTTLKCLSGLICPSQGKVSVLGYTPFDRKENFLKQIGLVMGQKNQLWWDLPAIESYILNKEIYEIPDKEFNRTLYELVTLLEVKDIMNIQVRKLSLGQRMKLELIGSLLHRPKVLFLDEPTIGLDVYMQKKLRNFICEYNQKFKATIILTSHYMDDVKELCKRVIIINFGKIIYDGHLDQIVKKYSEEKKITVVFSDKVEKNDLEKLGKVDFENFPKVILTLDASNVKRVAAKLLEDFPVEDLTIEDPEIEDVIREIFAERRK
jgi:ABC-2 type transport system ATP-binding protein